MADLVPKRTRIILELERRLKLIAPAAAPADGIEGNYHTALGGRVFYNRQRALADHELPAIVLLDGPEPETREVSSHSTHELDLELVLLTQKGGDAEAAALATHRLKADVERCLGEDRFLTEPATATRLAQDVRIVSADLHVDDSSAQVVVGMVVAVQVRYRTKPFNPYE